MGALVACRDNSQDETPNRTAETRNVPVEVGLPGYGISAAVPDAWVAEAKHNEAIPAEAWRIHPKGHEDEGVWLLVDWLPRRGRHSAYYPGGAGTDTKGSRVVVAGVPRDGNTSEAAFFRADFDVGEVALSVTVVAHDDDTRTTARQILARMRFDPSARPPDFPSPARRGLDLARGWATAHGHPTDGIVYTGPLPDTAQQGFTVFFDNGLQTLRVDPTTGKVEARPL